MTPITVVVGTDDTTLPTRMRDRLRERGMPCVLMVEPQAGQGILLAACAALAAEGISTVVHTDPAAAAAIAAELEPSLPRVALADDIGQVDQWVPAEAYTPEELAAVTARLQSMGYA